MNRNHHQLKLVHIHRSPCVHSWHILVSEDWLWSEVFQISKHKTKWSHDQWFVSGDLATASSYALSCGGWGWSGNSFCQTRCPIRFGGQASKANTSGETLWPQWVWTDLGMLCINGSFYNLYIYIPSQIYIYVGIGIKHASASSGGNGQELLRNAAKAQVRRMCTMKKKRTDLNVPQWVIDEYHKRPKNETAALLMSCNFDKARSAQLSVRIVPCCYLHVIYRVHQVINYMLYIYMSPMQLICVNMHEGIVYVDFCLGRLDLSLSWKSSSRRSPPKKLPSMKSGWVRGKWRKIMDGTSPVLKTCAKTLLWYWWVKLRITQICIFI